MAATYGLLSRPRTPAIRRPAVAARYEVIAAELIAAPPTGKGRAVRAAGTRS